MGEKRGSSGPPGRAGARGPKERTPVNGPSIPASEARAWIVVASYTVLLAVVSFLLFYHLDNHLFWGDEAETAILARNTIRYGVPKSFDGRNLVTLLGADVDSNKDKIWIWSPWLQEYMTAGAFLLFGEKTWAGRVPFAATGLAACALLGIVAYRIYRRHGVALASIALLGTSEIFLLHSRQCRYYSVTILAEVLLVWSVHEFLSRHGRRGLWILAIALTLQFYTNYIVAGANLPAIVLLLWLLYRQDKRDILDPLLALGLALGAAAPWFFYAHVWRQTRALVPEDHVLKVLHYMAEFHFHFVAWPVLLLPAVGLAAGAKAEKPKRDCCDGPPAALASASGNVGAGAVSGTELVLTCLMPSYLLVLVLAPGTYIRYLLPVLPVGCILSAAWTFRYVRWPTLAVGLIVVQCTTNTIAIGSGYPFRGKHTVRSPITDFTVGLTHPYQERVADVLGFFAKNASPGQTFFGVDNEFPLQFYTDLKIIDASLNGAVLADPLPDWITSESTSSVVNFLPVRLPAVVEPFYEPVTIQVHATVRTGSIPDPDNYQYASVQEIRPMVIYRLRPRNNQHRP